MRLVLENDSDNLKIRNAAIVACTKAALRIHSVGIAFPICEIAAHILLSLLR